MMRVSIVNSTVDRWMATAWIGGPYLVVNYFRTVN